MRLPSISAQIRLLSKDHAAYISEKNRRNHVVRKSAKKAAEERGKRARNKSSKGEKK